MIDQEKVSDFFNEEAGKDLTEAKARIKAVKLNTPGIYRMKVDSKKFIIKDSGKEIITPSLFLSDGMDNLVLSITLLVIDGTANVHTGSWFIQNIMLAASEKTRKDQKAYDNFKTALNISKQRLISLIGKNIENIKFDKQWVVENLLSEFNENDVEIRRHKMNNEVMCKFERTFYNDKPSLKFISMYEAKSGESSVEVVEENVEIPIVDPDLPNFDGPVNAADLGVERYTE